MKQTQSLRNRIIQFSGGKSSFAVAYWVKEKFPEENIILYFNDTLWEDSSLYSFNKEVSDKLQLPLLIQSKGITPPQLMVQKRFLANNRVGLCSQELKIKVSQEFFFKGKVPAIEQWYNKQYLKQDIHGDRDEAFFQNTTLYFGIGWDEAHRAEPIQLNWKPFEVQFPLIDEDIDKDGLLAKLNIEEPLLYRENFTHNNCAGRCVKGGMAHFKNLLLRREQSYQELKEQEIVISEYIRYMKQPQIQSGKCKDYLFKDVYEFISSGKKSDKIQNILVNVKYNNSKNRSFGVDSKGRPIKKPYSFMKKMTLAELENSNIQLDLWDQFDFGGCGCSVDYGTCNINKENLNHENFRMEY